MNLLPILLKVTAIIETSPAFEIPRAYWGEYDSRIEDCGAGLNDGRLRISWDTVQFYESRGKITELLRLGTGLIDQSRS